MSEELTRSRRAAKALERAPAKAASAATDAPHQWLLLAHHLPPEPAYFRVKVRRRLERIGSVALKNSVYVLPFGDDTQEDFAWLRQEIEREGGEATLCAASFLDETTDARLVEQFREARDTDYEAIAGDALSFAADVEEREMNEKQRYTARNRAGKLRERLGQVAQYDFFDAPGRQAAEHAISRLEALGRGTRGAKSTAASDPADRPRGRTWVTRKGVKVDRTASAWLIRRFIDPAARFEFVAPQGYEPQADELRFDMFGGEFTHEGENCTFEVLLARFALAEPALVAIGEIVHDIDCKDDKFGRAEGPGIASLIDGIVRRHADDEARLERAGALFEELYEHFRAGTGA